MALAPGSSSGGRCGAQRARADDAADLGLDERARTALRCPELGRPQFVVRLDQSLWNHPELDVEFVEVLGEEIAL